MKARGFDPNTMLRSSVLFVALGFLSGFVHAEPRKQDKRTTQTKPLQLTDVFRSGLPHGLIQFDVPNTRDSAQTATPRLAVLDDSGLHIYKVEGTKKSDLKEEFAVPSRGLGAEPWDTLEAVPSRYALPGVILWASDGDSYSTGMVICYLDEKPRILFKGHDFDLVNLTLDDVPEIVVWNDYYEVQRPAKTVVVWAWNERRYVKVEEVTVDQLYSQDVVKAIRAAQRQK